MFHNKIKKEVERVGFHLIATKPTNDSNIKSVLAFSDVNGEYVTWIYNVSMDGLYNGRYFTYFKDKSKKDEMFQKAQDDWNNRK